jgi:ring-1,2-phenylacetyl-CoA epoxidase subunit PaaE
VLAILKSVLTREPESRLALIYGSRSTRDIMFRETLEDLKDRFLDRLSVFHILSREAQDIQALSGRIDAAKLTAMLPTIMPPDAIDHVFICGPEGLITCAVTALATLGIPADRLHVERFTPSGTAKPSAPAEATQPATTATIIFEGKTNTIPMEAGEAVLDAALRAGLDLPWSCRGGMCSTCRAHLTEGTAIMAQNFSLEPWETDAGFILTCQAHPTTPHVTVDYDRV